MKRPTLGPKSKKFLEHLGLVSGGSLVTGMLPLAYTPGLAHASLNQWVGLCDHAGIQVLLFMSALLSTPITKAYGIGAIPTANTNMSAK